MPAGSGRCRLSVCSAHSCAQMCWPCCAYSCTVVMLCLAVCIGSDAGRCSCCHVRTAAAAAIQQHQQRCSSADATARRGWALARRAARGTTCSACQFGRVCCIGTCIQLCHQHQDSVCSTKHLEHCCATHLTTLAPLPFFAVMYAGSAHTTA